MPITEKQKQTLVEIIGQLEGLELVKVAGIVYQTVLESKLPSEQLMALGKHIFAGVTWGQIPNKLRFPFVKSTEEYMLKEFPGAFDIMPEPEAIPEAKPEAPVAAPVAAAATVEVAASAQAVGLATSAPAVETPPAEPEMEGEIGGPGDDGDLAAMVEASNGATHRNGNGSANGNGSREKKPEVTQEVAVEPSPAATAATVAAEAAEASSPSEESSLDTDDDSDDSNGIEESASEAQPS